MRRIAVLITAVTLIAALALSRGNVQGAPATATPPPSPSPPVYGTLSPGTTPTRVLPYRVYLPLVQR